VSRLSSCHRGGFSAWLLGYLSIPYVAFREPTRCHATSSACRSALNCLSLLYDLIQNWNLSINFSKTPQYQISRKYVQPFSSCYMRRDRWNQTDDGKADGSIPQPSDAKVTQLDSADYSIVCLRSMNMKNAPQKYSYLAMITWDYNSLQIKCCH
jgi:hypothetical protein